MRPMTDVVVLLPGITGSVLRDSAGRDVWAPTAGAAARALVTLGRSITDLELRDGDADDGVTAPLMVPDLHLIPGLWKIDGYSKPSAYLQRQFAVTPGRNFFAFPYDWRRDNRVAARRLKEQADRWLWQWRQESPEAKLILVGHSMGGLVARYFLECLDGWRDTRRLVTFGTPYRGSLNAVNFLVHGMQKRLGPIPVLDLSRLLRSFPSIYQLLPIYPCLDLGDGALMRVSEVAGLPHVDPERARAANGFHREIEQAVTAHLDDEEYRRGRYTIHPIVGTFQATLLSARRSGGGVEVLGSYPGFEPDGDGTVPRVSATPIEFPHEEGAMFAAERHGSLQHNDSVLVQLAGLRDRITQMTIVSQGDPVPWELLYPFARGGQDAGFLVDQFPVARRRYGLQPPRLLEIRAADLVLSGEGSLAAAPTEIAVLDGLLRGRGLAPQHIGDLPSLLRAFQRGDFGLLHFSCHNAFARGAPNASRVALGNQPFEPVFLEQYAGRFANPLVFLNACRTDGQAPLYTTVEGWAASFLQAGAGAFIGSLWEVADTSASAYAQQFYQAALNGRTLGQAARLARDAIRNAPGDPTWLAYTLYGNPAATVSTLPPHTG